MDTFVLVVFAVCPLLQLALVTTSPVSPRDSASYETFSKQRQITYTETRNAHRSYISSICSDSLNIFWSYIKSLKVDNIGIPTLNNNNKLESDNRLKADILNSQFKSQSSHAKTFTYHKNLAQTYLQYLTSSLLQKVLLNYYTPSTQIRQQPTGPDDIPARILQLADNELAPAQQIIFQKSLDTGKLTLSWLQANIAPIFKKGDRSLAANYRPIYLTSTICCKILEHIIFTNIMNHLDCYSVLTDRQHGFHSKHSTESQRIITTQDLAQSVNQQLQLDMIILDFSQAFDTVPHNILLNKLDRYGIRNKTHTWISNFLNYRKQRVVIGEENSTWTHVMSGIGETGVGWDKFSLGQCPSGPNDSPDGETNDVFGEQVTTAFTGATRIINAHFASEISPKITF